MLIVDAGGKGDFTSIQAAIDALSEKEEGKTKILIRPGIYRERVVIHRDHVRLSGEDAETTVITRSGCAKDLNPDGTERGTFLSATMLVTGRDVEIRNLTIRNDAGDGREVGQAVALYAAGDGCVMRGCRLLAHQDTLFCGPLMPKVIADVGAEYAGSAEVVTSVGDCPATHSRLRFEDCLIRGDIDFIFGPYRCLFENCELFMNERGGFYTAANTPEEQDLGLVFHRCRLTGACGNGQAYLGRPWRKYARTVFLDCEMDEHVAPEGFRDWDGERVITGRCGEWNTRGARADQSPRHPAQKRMTDEEAKHILESIKKDGKAE